MTKRSLSRDLYRIARLSRDVDALASGDPDRIARRIKNRVVGRVLGRLGFWHWLWK